LQKVPPRTPPQKLLNGFNLIGVTVLASSLQSPLAL
jgi:hypothetical protein